MEAVPIDLENLEYTKVSELELGKINFNLKVRVIKMWTAPDFKNPNIPYSLESIIMDEEGNKITASVSKKDIQKFQKYIVDGDCLVIRNAEVTFVRGPFRIIPGDLKLNFTNRTHMYPTDSFDGPRYGFQFTDFQSVLDLSMEDSTPVDVIGYVQHHYGVNDFIDRKGNPSKKSSIILEDLHGVRINVILWGEYAQQLADSLATRPEERFCVMIMQFGSFKIDNLKRPSVSNIYHATKLIMDTGVKEIKDYKRRLLEKHGDTGSSSGSSVGSNPLYNLFDDFVNKTEFFPIMKVQDVREVRNLVVVGKIVALEKEFHWCYLGCPKCNHKAEPVSQTTNNEEISAGTNEKTNYECVWDQCTETVVKPVVRYKVPITVKDSTGYTSLILFNRDSEKLIKKSAASLFDIVGDPSIYPEELNILLDMKFAFKVDITTWNLQHIRVACFGVKMMTNDEKIISELEKQLPNKQVAISEIIPVETAANLTDDSTGRSEVLTTKLSKTKMCTVGGKVIGVKRNLEAAFHEDLETNGEEQNVAAEDKPYA